MHGDGMDLLIDGPRDATKEPQVRMTGPRLDERASLSLERKLQPQALPKYL